MKGAADGEGLGNAFLSHIMAVDGIFHVCRAFDDADVVHVEDRVDPVEGRQSTLFPDLLDQSVGLLACLHLFVHR